MDFSSMLGAPAQQPQQPVMQDPNFTGMLQPQPDPVVMQMNKPAATPQEVEARKTGWLYLKEKFEDPVFVQSLGLAGAVLAQPRAPGQTSAGQVSQAFVAGTSAYNLGKQSQVEQARKDREEQRKQTESEANVEGTRANTRRTGVATESDILRQPGIKADSDVAAGTVKSRVDKVKLDLEDAQFRLGKMRKVEEVDALERELKARKLKLAREIPDATLLAEQEAEVEKAILAARQARANIAATRSGTALTDTKNEGAQLDNKKDELTYNVLRDMKPDELKEFLTKTGRYTTHTSRTWQDAGFYGTIYDKLPDTDPRKKGKTREQYQLDELKGGKIADVTKSLSDYLSAMDRAGVQPDQDIINSYTEIIKGRAGAARPGGPAPGTPGAPASGSVTRFEWVDGKLKEVK